MKKHTISKEMSLLVIMLIILILNIILIYKYLSLNQRFSQLNQRYTALEQKNVQIMNDLAELSVSNFDEINRVVNLYDENVEIYNNNWENQWEFNEVIVKCNPACLN